MGFYLGTRLIGSSVNFFKRVNAAAVLTGLEKE